MSELKDAGILVRMAHLGFMNAGIDPSAIYRRCNITAQLLADQRTRTPHHAQTLFWQACEDVTGDPLIGLHLGEHTPAVPRTSTGIPVPEQPTPLKKAYSAHCAINGC